MIKNRTDKEIYKLCETEQGTMEYIITTIADNYGYDWAYLNKEHAPTVDALIKKKYLIERKSHVGVLEFGVTQKGIDFFKSSTSPQPHQ